MFKVDLTDLTKLATELKVGFPQLTNRAVSSTLNKLAGQAKTKASSTIRETYNVKAGDLSKSLIVEKATPSNQTASIVGRGKAGIPLLLFGGRWTRPAKGKRGKIKGSTIGASVEVKRSQRKIIPETFIAQMKSGHQGIFKRASKKRLPIKELFGPQPALLLGLPNVVESVRELIRDKAIEIFRHEFDYYFKK
jgi:hypothetical protein